MYYRKLSVYSETYLILDVQTPVFCTFILTYTFYENLFFVK